MSRKASIGLAPSACADLESILAWYADQGVPDTGRRLIGEIVDRIESLADHSDIGRIVPEFAMPALRELIHPPFRAVYHHDGSCIRIVRVWRSERELKLG